RRDIGQVAADVGEVVAVVVRDEYVSDADIARVLTERAGRNPPASVTAERHVDRVRVCRILLDRGDVSLGQLAARRLAVAAQRARLMPSAGGADLRRRIAADVGGDAVGERQLLR